MPRIQSKVESLSALRFEPFPTGKNVTLTCVRVGERTVVGVDAGRGAVYTTQLSAGIGYVNLTKLSDTLRGCIKLNLLTEAALAEHRALVVEHEALRKGRWAATSLIQRFDEANLKFTAAQRKRVIELLGSRDEESEDEYTTLESL